MPHRGQCITPAAFLDPIHQSAYRYRVIRRRHQPRKVVRLVQAFYPQGGFRQSNPLDYALQNPWSGSPASDSANLMLDEPPLIVRMRG
jgi:hypothetical protein